MPPARSVCHTSVRHVSENTQLSAPKVSVFVCLIRILWSYLVTKSADIDTTRLVERPRCKTCSPLRRASTRHIPARTCTQSDGSWWLFSCSTARLWGRSTTTQTNPCLLDQQLFCRLPSNALETHHRWARAECLELGSHSNWSGGLGSNCGTRGASTRGRSGSTVSRIEPLRCPDIVAVAFWTGVVLNG